MNASLDIITKDSAVCKHIFEFSAKAEGGMAQNLAQNKRRG
jgi:hypothetical protein